jgi:hypothetical protein
MENINLGVQEPTIDECMVSRTDMDHGQTIVAALKAIACCQYSTPIMVSRIHKQLNA